MNLHLQSRQPHQPNQIRSKQAPIHLPLKSQYPLGHPLENQAARQLAGVVSDVINTPRIAIRMALVRSHPAVGIPMIWEENPPE